MKTLGWTILLVLLLAGCTGPDACEKQNGEWHKTGESEWRFWYMSCFKSVCVPVYHLEYEEWCHNATTGERIGNLERWR